MAKINFMEVEEGFPLWDPGEHPAVLSAVELKQASSKHYGFNLTFDPMEDDVRGKAWENVSLHPNALWRSKQTLTRLGLDPDLWAELGNMDSEDESTLRELHEAVNALIGTEVTLVTVHDTYKDSEGNPQTKNKIERILSAGASLMASLK
jgi:hypothetical protein